MSTSGSEVPVLELEPQPVAELADSIASIAMELQLTALMPTAQLQVPSFRDISRETRRAWAALFRRPADALDPGPDMEEQLMELGNYLDDWDDEGAPAPVEGAIDRARAVLDWATSNGVDVVGVDPDVEGGVGVFLEGSGGRKRVWIACMNDGSDAAVLSLGDRVSDHFLFGLSDGAGKKVLRFLGHE